ncbi:hypothetical protein GCM10020295_16590 [Streptomyces cinereospinus]
MVAGAVPAAAAVAAASVQVSAAGPAVARRVVLGGAGPAQVAAPAEREAPLVAHRIPPPSPGTRRTPVPAGPGVGEYVPAAGRARSLRGAGSELDVR